MRRITEGRATPLHNFTDIESLTIDEIRKEYWGLLREYELLRGANAYLLDALTVVRRDPKFRGLSDQTRMEMDKLQWMGEGCP